MAGGVALRDDGVLSDAALIAAVRAGDQEAAAGLYQRHAGAAWVVARQHADSLADADDIVADAFAAVFAALGRGRGPQESFRAYLFTVVRRVAVTRREAGRRVVPTDDVATLEAGTALAGTAEEPVLAGFERDVVARAFHSLPERWQAVLWHTEVEGLSPAQVAPMLGMSANGVAALAYRAREGLREAYLQQHLGNRLDDGCRAVAGKLGAYVRGGLSSRDEVKVAGHLEECGECRGLVLELRDVNHGMRSVVAPLVLGVAGLGALTHALPVGGGVAAGLVAALHGGGPGAGVATAAGAGAGAVAASGGAVAGGGAAGAGVAMGGAGGAVAGAGAGAAGAGAAGAAAVGVGAAGATTASAAGAAVAGAGAVTTGAAAGSLGASAVAAGAVGSAGAAGGTLAGVGAGMGAMSGALVGAGAGAASGGALSAVAAAGAAASVGVLGAGATAAGGVVSAGGLAGLLASVPMGIVGVTAGGLVVASAAMAGTVAILDPGTPTAVSTITTTPSSTSTPVPEAIAPPVPAAPSVAPTDLPTAEALSPTPAPTDAPGAETTTPADPTPADPPPVGPPAVAPVVPPQAPPGAPDTPSPDPPADPAPAPQPFAVALPSGGLALAAGVARQVLSFGITNTGDTPARGLVAELTLPTGVEVAGVSVAGVASTSSGRFGAPVGSGWVCTSGDAANTARCALADLAPHATRPLSLRVAVAGSFGPGGQLGLRVSGDGVDFVAAPIPVAFRSAPARLALGSAPPPLALVAGVPGTLHLDVVNAGGTTTDARVHVALPHGVRRASGDTGAWTCDAGAVVSCVRPGLAAGARAPLDLPLVAAASTDASQRWIVVTLAPAGHGAVARVPVSLTPAAVAAPTPTGGGHRPSHPSGCRFCRPGR